MFLQTSLHRKMDVCNKYRERVCCKMLWVCPIGRVQEWFQSKGSVQSHRHNFSIGGQPGTFYHWFAFDQFVDRGGRGWIGFGWLNATIAGTTAPGNHGCRIFCYFFQNLHRCFYLQSYNILHQQPVGTLPSIHNIYWPLYFQVYFLRLLLPEYPMQPSMSQNNPAKFYPIKYRLR